MRQFHVRVFYAHIKGSSFVTREESYITFARAYTINGMYVSEDWAELSFSPFGEMLLRQPEESRSPKLRDPYLAFLDSLTLDEVLESVDGETRIPVASIELIEGNWFDHPSSREAAATVA